MSCFVPVLIVLSRTILADYDAKEIAVVEERVIANRLAMHQWHMRVTFAVEDEDSRREPDAPVAAGYTSYVDGDRIRIDSTFRYAKKMPGVDEDSFTITTIWGNDEHIMYSTRRFEDGAKAALEVADRDWSLNEEHNGEIRIPPVRKMGMLPGGLLVDQPLTKCIGNPNRTELRMSDDVLNDIECKKLSFVSDGGLPTRVWVAPAMGYSVVRMEHDWKSKSHDYLDRTDVVVEEYQDTGIWFPVSAGWQRIQDSKVTTMRETVEVEILSLNEPLDPKFFSIADLNVPVGTFVNRRPYSGSFVWDGEQVVDEKSAELLDERVDERVDESGASGRRLALLATALLLAVLCGVFLWRHFGRE